MATYAIGDIHGCFKTLQSLLKKIDFRENHDRLWLVGDLVNRGPSSLEVLRWAKSLADRCISVLGNHDLYLLSFAQGAALDKTPTALLPILKAPDAYELLSWISHRPLLYQEENWVMVHAGILPAWTVAEAARHARGVETILQNFPSADFFYHAWHYKGSLWRKNLQEAAKNAIILAAFTRMRMCRSLSKMELSFTDNPAKASSNLRPWFDMPGRKSTTHHIIFGHWAALGFHQGPNWTALDSGCVWGGCLTALRLDDGAIFSQKTRDQVA